MFAKDTVKDIIRDGFFSFKLLSFSNSIMLDQAKPSRKISSRSIRAPEVLLGGSFDWRADMWSAGCLIFKTVTLKDMFHPEATRKCTLDESHFNQIIEYFGELPPSMLARFSKTRKGSAGLIKPHKPGSALAHKSQTNSLEEKLIAKSCLRKASAREFGAFLRRIMQPDSFKRCTALEAISDKWIMDSTVKGNIFMSQVEWQDHVWNQNMNESSVPKLKLEIPSENEEADASELLESSEEDNAIPKPINMCNTRECEDSDQSSIGSIRECDRSFTEQNLIDGFPHPKFIDLSKLDCSEDYADLLPPNLSPESLRQQNSGAI